MVGVILNDIQPQPGPQYEFLSNKADIVIYGGAAGSGKTYALLLEALWHYDNPKFNCAIFRKNANQIRNPGGLLSESQELYRDFGGNLRESIMEWDFPSGAIIKFAHLDLERDKYSWQGSQLCLIGFDELCHFSWGQFVYMLSRNRSTCGVKPYIRATCNPDSESWVRRFIDWWIDPETGYAIQERSGKIRWFIIRGDETYWSDTSRRIKRKI